MSLRLAQNGHAKHNKLKSAGLLKRSKWSFQKRQQFVDLLEPLFNKRVQTKMFSVSPALDYKKKCESANTVNTDVN